MIEQDIDKPFSEALGHIQDFVQIHNGESLDEYKQAIASLLESFGISNDLFRDFILWTEKFFDDPNIAPPLSLGLIIGLLVAEYASRE